MKLYQMSVQSRRRVTCGQSEPQAGIIFHRLTDESSCCPAPFLCAVR